jgi:hypothetical protein
MIVDVLTTCHTQYTSDSSICIFLYNRTTLQVFLTYLTGPLYVRNCRWTIVTDRQSWNVSTQNAFSLSFASILVNCASSGEIHNYCTPHIKENFENLLIHRCNYILLSQVYCVWQVVETPTIISNNPIYLGFSVFYQTSFLRCNSCVRWNFIEGCMNTCTVVATLCYSSKVTNGHTPNTLCVSLVWTVSAATLPWPQ